MPQAHEEDERLPTGIHGLDAILRGGLIPGAVYLVVGRPGAGKTILGNQLAFTHAKRGGRAVYATLLAETHTRMLRQVRRFSFFEEARVGSGVTFLSGLSALESDRFPGLLEALQQMLRQNRANLLVLDGLLSPSQFGASDLDYKRFVAALQVWSAMNECTVVILTTGSTERATSAEHTMVDGILELVTLDTEMRTLRELRVVKLRGSGFAEGRHAYILSDHGLEVFPRIEATRAVEDEREQPIGERVRSGIPGLDPILGGGLVRGSTTLLLGSSGSGKTIAGLQFLVEGASNGEPGLHFGFFEPPHAIVAKGAHLGLDVDALRRRGTLHLEWHGSTETILDRQAHRLIDVVRTRGIRRVLVDGFGGFRTSDHPERVASTLFAVANELSRDGVTVVITEETSELFVREIRVPTENVSGLVHNIVFLRQVEVEAQLRRLLSIMKSRDSAHDRRLWEFCIDEGGLKMRGPFDAIARGLMAGGKGDPIARQDATSERMGRDK